MLGQGNEETKLILPLGPHNYGPFQKSILLVNLTVSWVYMCVFSFLYK